MSINEVSSSGFADHVEGKRVQKNPQAQPPKRNPHRNFTSGLDRIEISDEAKKLHEVLEEIKNTRATLGSLNGIHRGKLQEVIDRLEGGFQHSKEMLRQAAGAIIEAGQVDDIIQTQEIVQQGQRAIADLPEYRQDRVEEVRARIDSLLASEEVYSSVAEKLLRILGAE